MTQTGCTVSDVDTLCCLEKHNDSYSKHHILKADWDRGYKTNFMLNSLENEIYPAHKC